MIGQELMAMYRLGEICGRPLDTTFTLARYPDRGLERHPLRPDALRACRRSDLHDRGSTRFRARAARVRAARAVGGRRACRPAFVRYVARLHLDTVTYGTAPCGPRSSASGRKGSSTAPIGRRCRSTSSARSGTCRSSASPPSRRRRSWAPTHGLSSASREDAAHWHSLARRRRAGRCRPRAERVAHHAACVAAVDARRRGPRPRPDRDAPRLRARRVWRVHRPARRRAGASVPRARDPGCGTPVDTVEGLADGDELHPVQAAFQRHRRCSAASARPGSSVLAAWLVEHEADADVERVREVLSSNLCRCTGYGPILAATLAAQAGAGA